MIHRVIYGSIDRFLGIITENFAGAFPVWLAPMQVEILPISEKFIDKCNEIKDVIAKAGVRVEVDERNEKIGYKIRSATQMKVPYILVVGENEVNNGTVSVRTRGSADSAVMPVEDFVKLVSEKIKNRD